MNAIPMIADCARHQQGDEPVWCDEMRAMRVRDPEALPVVLIAHTPSDQGVDGAAHQWGCTCLDCR